MTTKTPTPTTPNNLGEPIPTVPSAPIPTLPRPKPPAHCETDDGEPIPTVPSAPIPTLPKPNPPTRSSDWMSLSDNEEETGPYDFTIQLHWVGEERDVTPTPTPTAPGSPRGL